MLVERNITASAARIAAVGAAPVLVALRDVCVDRGGTLLLDRVTLDIAAGAPTFVVGPNGAGKTTLLKLGMGLIEADEGRVEHAQGVRASFVFQKPVMLRRSVAENVAYARRAANLDPEAKVVARLLSLVGLEHLAKRPARRLSGGEQQRLAIARALAREPVLLFLDEPTASLDPAATKTIEDIVSSVSAAGVKVVMATHDLGQARRLAGDVVFMVRGHIAEHAHGAEFFSNPRCEAARAFLRGDLVL